MGGDGYRKNGIVAFGINMSTDDKMLFGMNPDAPDFGGQHFASQAGGVHRG